LLPSITSPNTQEESQMNAVRRRLFRVFMQSGGDLTDDASVEQFKRRVEALLVLLPPKARQALRIAWSEPDPTPYGQLVKRVAKQERTTLSEPALRQRVSRGLRLLEAAILGTGAGQRPSL
jgi:hypothetical protein